MTTIFIDESGNTGANLLDQGQSVFGLASINLVEEDCQQLKDSFFSKVSAAELKYTSLKKYPASQKYILNFLTRLKSIPNSVKLLAADKKFMTLQKMADLLIEPAFYENNLDFYAEGNNIIFCNLLYKFLPYYEGQGFFDEVLVLFHKMMKSRDITDYDNFFETVLNHTYKDSKLETLFLGSMYAAEKIVGMDILESPKDTMDPATAAAFTLIALWNNDFQGKRATVIHDRSSIVAKQIDIWNALTNPNLSKEEVGYDIRTLILPLEVEEIKFETSHNWAGLQLADVLAGATVDSLKWFLSEKKEAGFYKEIHEALNFGGFYTHYLIASEEFTPEGLGTVGKKKGSYDRIGEILRDSKTTG